MKFFIASPWKNKDAVKSLSDALLTRGYDVYSFLDSGANLATGLSIAEELKSFTEALKNWQDDPRIKQIFESEMKGLKESDGLILLLPGGHSSLQEAGIAYGIGKKVAIIGPIVKPEVVYLIGEHYIYPDQETFLKDVDNFVAAAKGKR